MRSKWGVSCRVRSSRSVTCCRVSSIVAPGQMAETTIVRTVKAGSSFRPSFTKAKAPATSATIMK
jgi:hypothetical protein